jgi:hypothetical protein
MESTIFWDITTCSPLKVNRRFGGTYRLHLQGGSWWLRPGIFRKPKGRGTSVAESRYQATALKTVTENTNLCVICKV